MIVPGYYENLHMLHDRTMPNRCYYIPASRRMDDLVRHRERSDRMQLLNGTWKFRYYRSIYDLQEKFFETGYDDSGYDSIPVPGVWQMNGYDFHQYTNIRYPFPTDPPYVPQENPCGAYLRDFDYVRDENAPRAYLNFEGVSSCYYVWLNGTYVGYSQVSHSTSEFDVTDFLVEGRNRLAVLVLKWCDGSYLEDQDMFRMNGIFRDVYLLKRTETGITDYFVTTEQTDDAAKVRVRFRYLAQPAATSVEIYNAENKLVCRAEAAPTGAEDYPAAAELTIAEPQLWNPEQPYLYTLVLETEREVITDRLGVREIHIENNVVYVNGMPIRFHGVNRHESDPVTGYTISLEQTEKDLRIIREHNFHAIRTSHYPDVPYFYQLCDEYGFFVIDEADHESHGASELYCSDNGNWDTHVEHWNEPFADNSEFLEATLDRTQMCVHRDKNRPCVVIWSMGNESAYGCCFEAALAWTKRFDPSRLTHYESAQYRSKKKQYDYSNIDLYSMMYPDFETIQAYLDNRPDKPFLMCEYCHSMGNGPGDLEDYFALIHSNDAMCGGFIWEFCDHAIYKGVAENGKEMYWYGGDHGEYPHDGNFCTDGMVYPDRRPHTGLLEYKNVYRPARVKELRQETGTITLHSYMDFVDLADYLTARYAVTCDGKEIAAGELAVPHIAPHTDGEISLPLSVPAEGRCFLKVSCFRKDGDALLPEGYPLGFDELPLRNADSRNRQSMRLWNRQDIDAAAPEVEETDRFLILRSENYTYVYNKLTGTFECMEVGGQALLTRPMELNIWRAPTDNDRKIKLEWMDAGYNHSANRAYDTEYSVRGSTVRIHSTMSVVAPSVQRFLTLDTTWTISGRGSITVQMEAERNTEFPELPRFGLRLFLPRDMQDVCYCGAGPQESYADKRQASSYGRYQSTVRELHEDYIRPQENGSHCDSDYVMLTGDELRLTAVGAKPFAWNASVFTQEELERKKHNYELEECGSTVLCLDYAQNGIGSESCGPHLLPQYRLDGKHFSFALKLIPERR